MRHTLLLLATMLVSLPAAARGQADPAQMRGTWQIISVKDLRTGVVDTISKRRLMWTHYGNGYWTYIWMDRQRDTTTSYAKVWSDSGQIRFWAAGGLYWLKGADMHYTNLVSIEPHQVQLGGIERVVHVDDSTYTYHTAPNAQGVVSEYFHRRVDRWTPARTRSNADLIKGLWQIMSVRNVKTGEVDNIAQRQTIWFHVTDSIWSYIVSDKDRANTTPAQLARLSADERRLVNAGKIWNADGSNRFWASAGRYRVRGDTLQLWRDVSIEPRMVGHYSTERIIQLDDRTYVYRSTPDANGVEREYTHRRIE